MEQSLAQAQRLRQSILKKAFEGRLVAQDPNDEPAGVLLERIKTEKVPMGRNTEVKNYKGFMKSSAYLYYGNGEKKEIFGLLDMHNDAFVILTGHSEKNGDISCRKFENFTGNDSKRTTN